MYTKYSKLALISFSFKNGDVFIITDSFERADIKFCRMTQEGFTVGLIRVGDKVKKYKLIDFRGRDEVKKDINSK